MKRKPLTRAEIQAAYRRRQAKERREHERGLALAAYDLALADVARGTSREPDARLLTRIRTAYADRLLAARSKRLRHVLRLYT